MRKVLFTIATAYLLLLIVWLLPGFSTSKTHYEHRYSATEREKVIIKDVYDHMSQEIAIALWSSLGIYGLFAASMFCKTRPSEQKPMRAEDAKKTHD